MIICEGRRSIPIFQECGSDKMREWIDLVKKTRQTHWVKAAMSSILGSVVKFRELATLQLDVERN
jgi:hypothetical protein